MAKRRKQYSNQFKLKVALDAIKELQTINEIVSSHGVHLSQVKTWKKQYRMANCVWQPYCPTTAVARSA